MKCRICGIRRPRRYCPGVTGDICSLCCGVEREVTVDCPFDCPYLQEARKHEKPTDVVVDAVPNRDIEVTEEFLERHQGLIALIGSFVVRSSTGSPAAIDFDVREALASLVQTYRTLQSGLYYESTPTNPIAARIHAGVQEGIANIQKEVAARSGMATLRDAEILGVLAFLQRFEYSTNNGRRRGRAYLDTLRNHFSDIHVGPAPPAPPEESSIILP